MGGKNPEGQEEVQIYRSGISSSGVGSSSSSLPAVPCLASPSLQLSF